MRNAGKVLAAAGAIGLVVVLVWVMMRGGSPAERAELPLADAVTEEPAPHAPSMPGERLREPAVRSPEPNWRSDAGLPEGPPGGSR
jgi:hypothetical protein